MRLKMGYASKRDHSRKWRFAAMAPRGRGPADFGIIPS